MILDSVPFPLPLSAYPDLPGAGLSAILLSRIQQYGVWGCCLHLLAQFGLAKTIRISGRRLRLLCGLLLLAVRQPAVVPFVVLSPSLSS